MGEWGVSGGVAFPTPCPGQPHKVQNETEVKKKTEIKIMGGWADGWEGRKEGAPWQQSHAFYAPPMLRLALSRHTLLLLILGINSQRTEKLILLQVRDSMSDLTKREIGLGL